MSIYLVIDLMLHKVRDVYGAPDPLRIQRPLANMLEKRVPKGASVIRVVANPDGTLDLLDFGRPAGDYKVQRRLPQKDVPEWIIQAICMLRIAESHDLVADLGFKVSDSVYYIVNQEGESNE